MGVPPARPPGVSAPVGPTQAPRPPQPAAALWVRGIRFSTPHRPVSYLWERDYGFLTLNLHAENFSM